MAYRDENEALRSRVRQLERQLALSEGLVQRLLGKDPASKKTSQPDSIVGETVHRVDETSFELDLDDAGLDAIQRVVEARLGHSVTRRGGELRGRRVRLALLADGDGAFALATREHRTSLRLETDLRRLPVLVALSPMLGALTSLPVILWQMHLLHHFEPAVSASVTIPLVGLLMLLAAVVARSAANRLARRARDDHDGAWATLLELMREHGRPKARVAAIDAGDLADGRAEGDEPQPREAAASTEGQRR